MIYSFNNFNKLNENLKDAKKFAEKEAENVSNETEKKLVEATYNNIRMMLDKTVQSKYCHKKNNFYLALSFLKIALKEDISVFSNLTMLNKTDDDNHVIEDYNYDDDLIDEIIERDDSSLETLLCYILKYDKYLNHLPIKPIDNYTAKNVRKYHQKTEGNVNMGVYETLTDHIVRYLPIKLQANDWIKRFPSKLKSDYKQNHEDYDSVFISLFNTYRSIPDDEKKSIFSMYFGTTENTGKISKFNTVAEFLKDFKNKLSGNNTIEEISKKIEDYGNGIDLVYNDNNILIASISTHKASIEFGKDTSWCISNASSDFHYQNYCGYDKNNMQYFIWDFNKEISDDMFRIGITIKEDGTIDTAHDKSDGYISNIQSYFRKNLKIPFKKYIKSLSKSELNSRTKNKNINSTFEDLLTSEKSKNPKVNYKRARNYFMKHKDVINLDNDDVSDFFRKMILFGDIELIKYSIDKKVFKFNNYRSLAIHTAYEYNEDSYNYLFNIDDAFKYKDHNFKKTVDILFKNVKNKEDFKKLYDRFKEVNEEDDNFDLNEIIFESRGFLDKIIEDDNLDLLKYYIDDFNYKVPEISNPNNISSSPPILSYVYEYCDSMEIEGTPKPGKIATYLINQGYKDDKADYTILLYKKPEYSELLKKVLSNGFDDIEETAINYILSEPKDIDFFGICDMIGYDWKFDIGTYNHYAHVINRFFEHKNINDINKLLNKNMNFIISMKRQHYNDTINLEYYLNKEKNTNNAINVFNNFPPILEKFTINKDDEDKKKITDEYYELFFDYACENKILSIFEATAKYASRRFDNNFDYKKGEDSEFVKVILEKIIDKIDDISSYCDIYYNYDYKDLIIKKFSDVEFLQSNLAQLIDDDQNRGLLNALKAKGVITPKLIKDADISIGIYVKTIEDMKYLFDVLGGKARPSAIASYINYGIRDEKNKTIEESDLKIKAALELLQNNGASFQRD